MSNRLKFATFVVSVAISLNACTDATSAPAVAHNKLMTLSGPSFSSYDAPTRTLGVSMTIHGDVRTPGTYPITSSVSGGSGTYYYRWFYKICYADGWCNSAMQGFAEGVGLDSVNVAIYSDMYNMWFSVQVGDTQNPTWTGWYTTSRLGPSTQVPPSGTFSCIDDDWGVELYPFVDEFGYFRRNTCSGAKIRP